MKVLFIVPPHISFADFMTPASNARHVRKNDGRYYGSLLTDMPLGILSLSAYAKQHLPMEATLLDFNIDLNGLDGFEFPTFAAYFASVLHQYLGGEQRYDVIGVSTLFTPSYQNMLDIGACCRKLAPQAILVAGGGIPSVMYQEIYQASSDYDALCYGEGEKPFLGLLQATDRRSFLEQHPSWITRAKLAAGSPFAYDFIDDLDEIPFYDYELCDMPRYGVNPAITAYASIGNPLNNFQVMTSRGCPFKCTFCASHKVHGRSMRYYSIDRVEADFLRLKEHYGASILVFQDDHFMGDQKRALAIIRMVKRLGLKAVFQNGLTLYALDREMLEALKAAGSDQLVLSIESGSERVLKELMHKPLKRSIVKRVADDCRELGIYTNANILIGMPGETKADIEDARRFLKTVNANWFIILCTSPLVGSEIHEICVEKNYIKAGFIGSDFRRSVIETEDFSADYIQEIAYVMNLELNFVENSDMRIGHYQEALQGFHNALRAKHDHAFAHHFAAKCYEHLGEITKAEEHRQSARRLHQESTYWQHYFHLFGIVP